ncbi:helix-turn-helix domain-containing protein [Streptosporangium sp. NPDC006013]|uniref:helix-turn-helix domain-containing protein n=1 Tax=Streptosporangium sp. NPDC006013 TaxID=3155596 RepID=UPI0033BA5CB8
MAQSISSQALARQREFVGMSVTELAEAVGVTSRAVRYWEAGTRTVGDRYFGRLLKVLGCDAQDLTGREQGTETLTDLRRAAGMSAEETASALRGKQAAQGLNVSAEKIRDLESGRQVCGWTWRSPETLGQVVRLLVQVYGVPDRLVMDAWRRSRPQDPLPVLPARRPHQKSTESLTAWHSLNERQRIYLTCIFSQDQEAEKEQRRKQHAGEVSQSAAVWRRMTMALSAPPNIVGYTTLQERLRRAGVHDPGAGSSMAALERRDLIKAYRDRVYIDGLGDVPRTRVEMTRRGRAVARAGLGVPRETGAPAPLLSQWLWKITIRVARAGEQGVDGSLAGRGPHYLAVGQSPDGRTPSRGFIVLRHPNGVTHGPYRWFLSDSGKRHIIDYLDAYRTMYPEVDTEGIEEISR